MDRLTLASELFAAYDGQIPATNDAIDYARDHGTSLVALRITDYLLENYSLQPKRSHRFPAPLRADTRLDSARYQQALRDDVLAQCYAHLCAEQSDSSFEDDYRIASRFADEFIKRRFPS